MIFHRNLHHLSQHPPNCSEWLITATHAKRHPRTLDLDGDADNRRVSRLLHQGGPQASLSYDTVGNLSVLDDSRGYRQSFTWDGDRKLREVVTVTDGVTREAVYRYDLKRRRIFSTGIGLEQNLVFAYDESRLIAIGLQDQRVTIDPEAPGGYNGITWTHAIGHGPLGPVLIKDLTGGGHDYFILTNQLGTPFAYRNANTGDTFYTPYGPWGDLLVTAPGRAPPHTHGEATINAEGFATPPDSVFDLPPVGLTGQHGGPRQGQERRPVCRLQLEPVAHIPYQVAYAVAQVKVQRKGERDQHQPSGPGVEQRGSCARPWSCRSAVSAGRGGSGCETA